MAVVSGAPGVLAVLLALVGVAVRRRNPVAGVVLAAVGLGVAALPLLLVVTWLAPLPMF
ncbi:hypothetical protein [Nocardioides sp. TF02-7]|uniref:hypothetical protein n=1 Tax=Nocardioides sp. TF02-7 TaxID=2917724 RepID=UPI001F051326|nr:hypothetical protein [Nocardioides sp. TF02-7]UMG95011.1 hypothetical protein MF408_09535 [Nocardioides sp. TF02-7]